MKISENIKSFGKTMSLTLSQETSCSICFEEMTETNSRRLNPCGHKFHRHCIYVSLVLLLLDLLFHHLLHSIWQEWMHSAGGAGNTCPMCRNYMAQVTRELTNISLTFVLEWIWFLSSALSLDILPQEDEFPDLPQAGHRRH